MDVRTFAMQRAGQVLSGQLDASAWLHRIYYSPDCPEAQEIRLTPKLDFAVWHVTYRRDRTPLEEPCSTRLDGTFVCFDHALHALDNNVREWRACDAEERAGVCEWHQEQQLRYHCA